MAKNRLSDQENKAIAAEVINQLGGRQFIAMTGARDIVALDSSDYPDGGVQFGFKGSTQANKCVVVLNYDLYTVTFWKIRGVTCKKVYELEGVYNDMLQSIFTEVTGLDCTLGTMGR